MLETLSQLPVIHQAYLAVAICGFLAFGVTLASVALYTRK